MGWVVRHAGEGHHLVAHGEVVWRRLCGSYCASATGATGIAASCPAEVRPGRSRGRWNKLSRGHHPERPGGHPLDGQAVDLGHIPRASAAPRGRRGGPMAWHPTVVRLPLCRDDEDTAALPDGPRAATGLTPTEALALVALHGHQLTGPGPLDAWQPPPPRAQVGTDPEADARPARRRRRDRKPGPEVGRYLQLARGPAIRRVRSQPRRGPGVDLNGGRTTAGAWLGDWNRDERLRRPVGPVWRPTTAVLGETCQDGVRSRLVGLAEDLQRQAEAAALRLPQAEDVAGLAAEARMAAEAWRAPGLLVTGSEELELHAEQAEWLLTAPARLARLVQTHDWVAEARAKHCTHPHWVGDEYFDYGADPAPSEDSSVHELELNSDLSPSPGAGGGGQGPPLARPRVTFAGVHQEYPIYPRGR